MEDITTFAISNAGWILGLLSIIATAFFAIRYSEKKEPKFESINDVKIRPSIDAPEDVRIVFKGQEVNRVTSTIFWFWNGGRRPIKSEDIPSGQDLTITLSDDEKIEILDVYKIKDSRKAIDFKVDKISSGSVAISFKFLDQNDGAAVEIIHTGTRSTKVKMDGVILGAPKGIKGASAGRRAFSLYYPLAPFIVFFGDAYIFGDTYKRGKRLSWIARLAATAILIVFLGGMAMLVSQDPNRLSMSRTELTENLRDFVPENQLETAVSHIQANTSSKFKIWAIYAIIFIFLIQLIIGLFALWGSPFSFPNSLLLEEKDRDALPAIDELSGEDPE